MKKLLVLLFVAAMCIPCYGTVADSNIFVYKFTRTFDPWIDYNDATQALATNVGTQRMTGYLVLNADVNTDANTWRLNADPTIIFYGGIGSDKWGVSFDVNNDVNDANGSMDVSLFSLRARQIRVYCLSSMRILNRIEWGLPGAPYTARRPEKLI